MRSIQEDRRRRYAENLELGRALALRLADEAERIAATLESLAEVQEALAGSGRHPLAGMAAERARSERRIAARERVASVWFTSIADGSYQPGEGPAGPPGLAVGDDAPAPGSTRVG